MLNRVRRAMAEAKTLTTVLSEQRQNPGVVFYAEDDFTYVQFEGYVNEFLEKGSATYVTSAEDDPLLRGAPTGLRVVHLNEQVPQLFRRLEGSVMVTTMPDLGQFHVPAPELATTVYVFHSLNSVHTSYRTGAFDHYDIVFATGPHHVRELEAMAALRGLRRPRIEEVGYYKLDRIADAHAKFRRQHPRETSVVVAPSWAPGNILEAHGEDVIQQLLATGLRVVVRPHPQFFHSLYPQGRSIIEELKRRFQADGSVLFEDSIASEESFHEASLMISDWSGAAFEFALGTLRPVLFLDTPQKLFNSEWEGLGQPAFEDVMRHEVGEVVPLSDLQVGPAAERLINQSNEWDERLRSLRTDLVFNFGSSAAAGARLLGECASP